MHTCVVNGKQPQNQPPKIPFDFTFSIVTNRFKIAHRLINDKLFRFIVTIENAIANDTISVNLMSCARNYWVICTHFKSSKSNHRTIRLNEIAFV